MPRRKAKTGDGMGAYEKLLEAAQAAQALTMGEYENLAKKLEEFIEALPPEHRELQLMSFGKHPLAGVRIRDLPRIVREDPDKALEVAKYIVEQVKWLERLEG